MYNEMLSPIPFTLELLGSIPFTLWSLFHVHFELLVLFYTHLSGWPIPYTSSCWAFNSCAPVLLQCAVLKTVICIPLQHKLNYFPPVLHAFSTSLLQEARDGVTQYFVQDDPESRRKAAMHDPEVQAILNDPAMQLILQQMQSQPEALRE